MKKLSTIRVPQVQDPGSVRARARFNRRACAATEQTPSLFVGAVLPAKTATRRAGVDRREHPLFPRYVSLRRSLDEAGSLAGDGWFEADRSSIRHRT